MSNKLVSENVNVNCEYTKKNCTKLSFITNADKIILSITPYIVNNKEIDYEQIKLINKEKNKIKNLMIENKELKKLKTKKYKH
jgi:hypothetical protein